MKRRDEIEKIKKMSDKELFRLVRENKKVQTDNKYYKENYLKFQKLHSMLLWKKDNNPEEFDLEQKKAAIYKLKTWTDRITFVIKTENRFLTSDEIYTVLSKYYPLETWWVYPMGTLRQNIHLAVGYGLIKSVIFRGRRAHYFGIPSFYDSLGKIKTEYQNQLDNL